MTYPWLCYVWLAQSRSGPTDRSPNPNNPSEYCSTIPPHQQANAHTPAPTVLVPVGVLKREGEFSPIPVYPIYILSNACSKPPSQRQTSFI